MIHGMPRAHVGWLAMIVCSPMRIVAPFVVVLPPVRMPGGLLRLQNLYFALEFGEQHGIGLFPVLVPIPSLIRAV